MTLSTIQKRKFLETVYKNYFSSGVKITDEKVLELYSKYFSQNVPGFHIRLQPEIFRASTFSNVDIINEKNAQLLLNIENLYDSVYENSTDMFDVTNALNNRIEQLRKRRAELEAKVDDLIFANQNSDGFYASVSESFSSGKNMDYAYSSCYLDTVNKKVTLSKLNSANFDLISTNSIVSPNSTYSLSFNRNMVETNKAFDDSSFFSSVFDGLNNTEWSKVFDFNSIGVVTLTINIPITRTANISKIEGRLNTATPIDIYAKINYSSDEFKPEIKSKKSSLDYDNFSFDFTPGIVSSIDLILVKTEPDYIDESSVNRYKYRFGIRDIVISGQYYDKYGVYVSNPYELKTSDNTNLVIDSVSIDVEEGNAENSYISYYIAEDLGTESDISDFNWIPISKPYDVASSVTSTISLNGSSVTSKKIVDNVSSPEKELRKIALQQSSTTANINAENPTQRIYSGLPIYRIAQVPNEEVPYSSYILEGINSVGGYYVNYVSGIYNESNVLSTWTELINGTNQTRQLYSLPAFSISYDPVFFNGPSLSEVSMLIPFNIYCSNDIVVKHKFSKNDQISQFWDVAIYINETKYIIPSGKSSEEIEWRFQKGINRIKIAIDCSKPSSDTKGPSAKGSITLMESHSILEYGIIYEQYYSYVDPLDLRYNRSAFDNVFTVDSVFGNKEIISRKNIKSNSRIFYYINNPKPVQRIRLRADFHRGNNPLVTPTLQSYRIKFKNSQSFSDISASLISNNSSGLEI